MVVVLQACSNLPQHAPREILLPFFWWAYSHSTRILLMILLPFYGWFFHSTCDSTWWFYSLSTDCTPILLMILSPFYWHLDHGSVLESIRVYLHHGSALGCIRVHRDVLECTCIMGVYLFHESAVGLWVHLDHRSARGAWECTSMMGEHLVAHECTVVMRVHWDAWECTKPLHILCILNMQHKALYIYIMYRLT